MERSSLTEQPKRGNKLSMLKRVVTPVLVVGMLVLVAMLYGYRVYDYFAARAFTPSAQVGALHDELRLTDWGSDLFYASKPQIQSGQTFNKSCASTERTAAILGCFHQADIFLYQVTNTDLAGAEEATAAHEILHAAYQQLNFIDRPRVERLVDAEYEKVKDRADIKSLMQYYQKAEPGELANELHSIIGMTIKDIDPELESYYARYFTDRAAIVAMNNKYTAVFKESEAKAKDLSTKIDALKPQLNASLAAYDSDLAKLNSDIATFNERAKSGYYTTDALFRAARANMLSRVDQLNARRSDINAVVSTYNEYVSQLNAIAVKVDQLNSSINAAPVAGGL